MQYVLGGIGNKHTLELPSTSRMQAGRVAIVAENTVGKAVSAAALNIIGKYMFYLLSQADHFYSSSRNTP